MKLPVYEVHVVAGQDSREGWRELWRYRHLLFFLVWRDLKVRYKQTALGIGWMLLRPVLMLIVLTFVFHRVAGLGQDLQVPYALVVLAGLLPWQFFAHTLNDASTSLVRNARLLSQVYFPRMMIPAGAVVAGLVDLMVTFLLLVPISLWYGHFPDTRILLLPAFVLLLFVLALSVAMIFSALNVRYRDIGFLIPFILQFGLFVSPVGFPSELVPEGIRWLYDLNPMVGVIAGFRWCLLGDGSEFPISELASGVLVTSALASIAWIYFKYHEKTFADVI